MAEIALRLFDGAKYQDCRSFMECCQKDIEITKDQPLLEAENTGICPVTGEKISLSSGGVCVKTDCEYHGW